MTQELKIKEAEINIVFLPEGKDVEDVAMEMGRVDVGSGGFRLGVFDDNGAPPDGPMYILPEYEIDPGVVLQAIREGNLYEGVGDIVEYSGRGWEQVLMDEKYPSGWAGFSSRSEAYGWTPEA